MSNRFVSIHGGHSGEFCSHAEDTLELIVQEYIRKGFVWVGILDHIPFPRKDLFYDEEVEAGFTVRSVYDRFARFIETARRIQKKYENDIRIAVGVETEVFSGYVSYTKDIIRTFQPDYIVGSVHHIDDMVFDGRHKNYMRVARSCGGVRKMYLRYFDVQYEMIESLRPNVVGHFCYIRRFDENYKYYLSLPEVKKKIERNLKEIKKHNIILDYNMSALRKGLHEPFIVRPILKKAYDLGIRVIPGDDSHSVGTVGLGIEEGIKTLEEIGFDVSFLYPF